MFRLFPEIPALWCAAVVSLSCACDSHEHEHELPTGETPRVHVAEGPSRDARPPAAHPAAKHAKNAMHHEMLPPPVMPDARDHFEEVLDVIQDKYVDGPLDDDALYTAAIEGVMHRLIQHGDHRINALLSPRQMQELKVGTSGKLVGIGVMIERVADVVVVNGVIPGGAAEAADLAVGDRILRIDDEPTKEMSLPEVADRIRGEEGTTVSLLVQRDTEEWEAPLSRGTISVPSVEGRMLDDGIAYVTLSGFSESTATDLDALLGSLQEQGMEHLMLDLRYCPGGLLSSGVAVTDLFLGGESEIVSVRGRSGDGESTLAKDGDAWEQLPLTLLVGPYTASSAEIMAAALGEHDRARLVGAPTMGKGTVETVHELGEGWGLKLSVSRFYSPNGEARHGNGVQPDLPIPPETDKPHRKLADVSVEGDPTLAAAVGLASTQR